MEKLIEVGVGKASALRGSSQVSISGEAAFAVGRAAALDALADITQHEPSLTLVFASALYEGDALAAGVASAVGGCPMIGASTSGEICGESLAGSVVVTILASPHLRAEVGVGKEVSHDWLSAIHEALAPGPMTGYVRDLMKLGAPHYFRHPRTSIAPMFALLFSPRADAENPPPNRELHEFLRNTTAGRLPIVGGMSTTPDLRWADYQIANGRAYHDAVVLAMVETTLLFGIGVGHSYRPTGRRAMVTKAKGSAVLELDDRPALDVYAEAVGAGREQLLNDSTWFERRPLGIPDAFGNYAILAPEQAGADGALHFGWSVEGTQMVTLMEPRPRHRISATREAVQKALAIGHMKEPTALILFSCKSPKEDTRSVHLSLSTGFVTNGQYGIEQDGLCIICNCSVVALAIGDDLEPRAAETRSRANTLREIETRLARKSAEFDCLRQAGEVVFDQNDWTRTFPEFEKILRELTGATSVIFHIQPENPPSPPVPAGPSPATAHPHTSVFLPLSRRDRTLGWIELQADSDLQSLEAAASIADVIASGIKRAQMEKTIGEQSREIDTVHRIAQEILTATNYRLALMNISEAILQHVGACRYALYIGTSEDNLRLQVATSLDNQRQDEELAAQAVASKAMARESSSSYHLIALPLVVNEKVNGALVLAFAPDTALVEGELGFLVYLSMPLAMMVDIFNRQRESTVAREIHHRVKNNLQVIASLLSLQLRRLEEPQAKEALEDSIRRIMSISVVHKFLSGKQLERVDALGLVRDVSESVVTSMRAPEQQFVVSVQGTATLEISPRQATSLAVIVNELVGNAIKHGFGDTDSGTLSILLSTENRQVVLDIQNRPGSLPPDFVLEQATGLGLQLVTSITESELSGSFSLRPLLDGVQARLVFPLE